MRKRKRGRKVKEEGGRTDGRTDSRRERKVEEEGKVNGKEMRREEKRGRKMERKREEKKRGRGRETEGQRECLKRYFSYHRCTRKFLAIIRSSYSTPLITFAPLKLAYNYYINNFSLQFVSKRGESCLAAYLVASFGPSLLRSRDKGVDAAALLPFAPIRLPCNRFLITNFVLI